MAFLNRKQNQLKSAKFPKVYNISIEKTEQYIESKFNDYFSCKNDYCEVTKGLFPEVLECNESLVQPETTENDSVNTLIKKSRETGVLKLVRKKLSEVPNEVWTNDSGIQNGQKMVGGKSNNLKIKDNPRFRHKPLVYLDLSNNSIQSFSPKGQPLFTLKELHVNACWLTVIPEDVLKLRSLKVLSLEDNGLTVLPFCLGNLIHLVELNVSKNYIEELPRSIKQLVNLQKLNISNNFIAVIPYELSCLKTLEEFNTAYNKLYSIPEETQKLTSLKIINVSNNYITHLPKFSFMSNLIKFIASSNDISKFPNFYSCRKLIEIHLDNNKLNEISLGNLHAVPLKKLCLQNNLLIKLPEDIDSISSLSYLDVRKNELTSIPQKLALMRKLKVLKIEGNLIRNMDPEVCKSSSKTLMYLAEKVVKHDEVNTNDKFGFIKRSDNLVSNKNNNNNNSTKIEMKSGQLVLKKLWLKSLTNKVIRKAKEAKISKIDLSKNNFNYVPQGLQQLTSSLTEIILKHNNLKALPDFIGQMSVLVHLDVSYNNLETLPISMRTCILRNLIAENNNFQTIPRVVYLIKTLRCINFHENKIIKIDVNSLKNLTNLVSLDLGNNFIQKVPSQLGHLTHIKELHLYGNLFKYPQICVLNNGTKAVMKYLREKIVKDEILL